MIRNFEKNVFINCPFDEDYNKLLRPLVFTILYFGLNPRISSERFDSGEARISKISEIISECKYGIHDISRIKSKRSSEYYRLNMPFELGLDIGCRIYNNSHLMKKCHLILESKPYRYQKAISDLSNSDIKYHSDDPIKLIRQLRNWFSENGFDNVYSPTKIWYEFNDFMKEFDDKRIRNGFTDDDIYEIPVAEYIREMQKWIKNSKAL